MDSQLMSVDSGKKGKYKRHEVEPEVDVGSSEGLTEAEEEDMRLVNLFVRYTYSYHHIFFSQALAASRASADAKLRKLTGESSFSHPSSASSFPRSSRSTIDKKKKAEVLENDDEPSGGSLGGDVIQKRSFPVPLKVSVSNNTLPMFQLIDYDFGRNSNSLKNLSSYAISKLSKAIISRTHISCFWLYVLIYFKVSFLINAK
jgi:hypothetical protein